MVVAAPLLGPIVFFIFVLCPSIILVNIFLTLIISAFETVKHDVMKQDNEYEIIDFMKKKVQNLLGLYEFKVELEEELDEEEKQLRLIEEQIASLPSKMDHLLHMMNKSNNTSQKDFKANPNIYNILEPEQLARDTGRHVGGRRNRRRSNANWQKSSIRAPKIAFLDWNEINE